MAKYLSCLGKIEIEIAPLPSYQSGGVVHPSVVETTRQPHQSEAGQMQHSSHEIATFCWLQFHGRYHGPGRNCVNMGGRWQKRNPQRI